jgi:hypothetical protein
MIAIYDNQGAITGVLEGSLASPPEGANWIDVPEDLEPVGARGLINGFKVQSGSFVQKTV